MNQLLLALLIQAVVAEKSVAGAHRFPFNHRPQNHRETAEWVWKKSLTDGAETSMRADITITTRSNGVYSTVKGDIVQGQQGQFKIQYRFPHNVAGRSITTDGVQVWQFDPIGNSLTTSLQVSGTGQAMRKTDPLISTNYRIALVSDHEFVAGLPSYLIEWSPIQPGKSIQRRWIAKNTFKALRIQTRYLDGTISRTIEYDHIRFVKHILKSEFTPSLRSKPRIINDLNEFDSLPAKELKKHAELLGLKGTAPFGFQVIRIARNMIESKPGMQVMLHDGIESISVFVQLGGIMPKTTPPMWRKISLSNVNAFQQTVGHTTTLVWSLNGRRFTAVSHISPENLAGVVLSFLK